MARRKPCSQVWRLDKSGKVIVPSFLGYSSDASQPAQPRRSLSALREWRKLCAADRDRSPQEQPRSRWSVELCEIWLQNSEAGVAKLYMKPISLIYPLDRSCWSFNVHLLKDHFSWFELTTVPASTVPTSPYLIP